MGVKTVVCLPHSSSQLENDLGMPRPGLAGWLFLGQFSPVEGGDCLGVFLKALLTDFELHPARLLFTQLLHLHLCKMSVAQLGLWTPVFAELGAFCSL